MPLPRGAFAPIPTPLDESGIFDPQALRRHLEFLAESGLDGALIMGTNGEFPSFDVNERMAVAEAAAKFGGGLDLMLGVGSCAVPECVHFVRTAAFFGYRSVLVPPPFYFRAAPAEGLIAFFTAVLEAAELPVLLYHIPQVTGVPISDEIIGALIDHPRFSGVKDSSGDAAELDRFIGRIGDRAYLVGTDRLVSASVARGGGSITAVASVVPELVSATRQDPGRQPELDAVRGLLESYGLGPAVKEILRARGVGAYRTRPPLVGLDPAAASRLVREFDDLVGL